MSFIVHLRESSVWRSQQKSKPKKRTWILDFEQFGEILNDGDDSDIASFLLADFTQWEDSLQAS